MAASSLTVLGVGNILLSDESIGVRLMQAVRDARDWPDEVLFVDGGVGGLGLMELIERAERLVVFDAAEMGLSPGEHRVISPEQVAPGPDRPRVSLHEVSFIQTLRLCAEHFRAPSEVKVLAIQPKCLDYGQSLSNELIEAFDRLVEAGVQLVAEMAGGASRARASS